MALSTIQVYSKTLEMQTEVWVVLPDLAAFSYPGKKFKVLWTMPSGMENYSDWIRHSDIENIAIAKELVVIMPNLHRSCGTDMHMGGQYAKWVAEELPVTMRNLFPFLSSKREDNYIIGFSNGGYACMYIALKYPNRFFAIGAFAAGDKADVDWSNRPWEQKVPVFGPGDLHETSSSFKYLAKKLVEDNSPVLPKVFHVYGLEDPFVQMNEVVRKFFEAYKEKGDPFYYQVRPLPGYGHDFRMCEIGLQEFLKQYVG